MGVYDELPKSGDKDLEVDGSDGGGVRGNSMSEWDALHACTEEMSVF